MKRPVGEDGRSTRQTAWRWEWLLIEIRSERCPEVGLSSPPKPHPFLCFKNSVITMFET